MDFTKEIQLEKHWQKKYNASRTMLYISFIAGSIFISYKILFPSVPFTYSFANSNSLKNTIVSIKTQSQNPPKKGLVNSGETLSFNTNPLGSFSDVNLQITSSKPLNPLSNTPIEVRKSYQAFFYPQGEPIGFKNGTLLSVGSDLYMISSQKLRKFSNSIIASELGFNSNNFLAVSKDDLAYNLVGQDIKDSADLPDGTLIKSSGNYYELENGNLISFISDRAFLSRYLDSQAIEKNTEFLKQFPLSEKTIGFADGTLGASEQSVFILSKGKSYPIDNALTIPAMGFDWNNVLALTPDEFGQLERQKQFTDDQPHPDGTIFFDQESENYYIVDNMQLRPIKKIAIAKTYPIKNAIKVNSQSLKKVVTCKLEQGIIYKNAYSCNLKLDDINFLPGNDYEFTARFNSSSSIGSIDTIFYTPISWNNLRLALSKIKTNISNNYIQP